ncbi:MAG: alcohol dehydrogenase catalytic domain-containing protein [Acidimicrobiia bacterium]
MRAVVLNGPGDISVEEVDDPVLTGPDGVVLRVERTAICGSDLHPYHGDAAHPRMRMGHEFIGTVIEAGADVRSVRVGDRVLASGVVGCGRCRQCVAGWPMRCEAQASAVFGAALGDLPGGQAEAVAVPAADAFTRPIPEGVTDEQAVLLTDILPTGFIGARRADISPGATVVVIGLGPVGICALRSALLYSPARVLAVDPVAHRRAHAERIGAEPIDPTDGGAVEQVMAATGGRGADAVIEAVGREETINDAIMAVAPGGTVSVVGVSSSFEHPFPMVVAMVKGITFRICVADIPSTWGNLIPLVASGRLHPEDVFTHHLGLSQAPEAYRLFDAKDDGVVKVLLDPTG